MLWRVANSLLKNVSFRIKLFDFFVERHPLVAFYLPFAAIFPVLTLQITVFSLPIFPNEVQWLFFILLNPVFLICFALTVRIIRFMPKAISHFEFDTSKLPKIDYRIKKDILQSAAVYTRLVLRYPAFTLYALLLWTFPFGLIVWDTLFFGGPKQTNPVMIAFAVCMITFVILSFILFFKALRLIIYSEGGMRAISDKAGT